MPVEHMITRSKNTLVQMLMKRSYSFIEEKDQILFFSNDMNHKIVAKIFTDDKLNIDSLKEFLAFIYSNNVMHGIIIYSNVITSSSKKILEHLSKIYIELFDICELQYDITSHTLYCDHEKIDDDEKIHLTPYITKLPILLKTDPVAKYFNFQKNDVIRICRKNGTIAYRLVR